MKLITSLILLIVVSLPVIAGSNYIRESFDNGMTVLQWTSKDGSSWRIGSGGLNNSYALIINFWGSGRGETYSNYIETGDKWTLSMYFRVAPSSIEVTGSSYPLYIYLENPNTTITIKYVGGYAIDGVHFIFKIIVIWNKTLTVTYDGPISSYASPRWIHLILEDKEKLTITIYRVENETIKNETLLGKLTTKRINTPSIRIRVSKSWNFAGKIFIDNLEILGEKHAADMYDSLIIHNYKLLITGIALLAILLIIGIAKSHGRPRRK